MTLYCVVCSASGGKYFINEATYISNGHSVCTEHLSFAGMNEAVANKRTYDANMERWREE